MRFNSFIKINAAIVLLTGSLSAFAMTEQIKCPSANFMKSQFADALNDVTRVEVNKFVVNSWDNIFDAESNHTWTVEIFADTVDDYDFNAAYKVAQFALANNVARPQYPYIGADETYCNYLDENDSMSMVLALLVKDTQTKANSLVFNGLRHPLIFPTAK